MGASGVQVVTVKAEGDQIGSWDSWPRYSDIYSMTIVSSNKISWGLPSKRPLQEVQSVTLSARDGVFIEILHCSDFPFLYEHSFPHLYPPPYCFRRSPSTAPPSMFVPFL